jgi:hypothetical protein
MVKEDKSLEELWVVSYEYDRVVDGGWYTMVGLLMRVGVVLVDICQDRRRMKRI